MEKRLLLAFFISAVIFVVWSAIFPPPKPQPRAVGKAAEKPAAPAPAAATEGERAPTPPPAPVSRAANAELAGEATTALAEKTVSLENPLVHLELSNRGAAITSLVLRRYDDDEGRPLNLIQNVNLTDRALPLQLVTAGRPDGRLYEVEKLKDGYDFRWSDGQSEVRKTVRLLPGSYQIEFKVSVFGAEPPPTVAVGTGMRNIGKMEVENRFATWGNAALFANGELKRFKRKKITEAQTFRLKSLEMAGFEDTYFLNVMRPEGGEQTVRIVPLMLPVAPEESARADTAKKGKKEKKGDRTVLEVSVTPVGNTLAGRLFSGPKEYDLLQRVDHGVEKTLHFGIFNPISVIFLKALRWTNGLVGNYGLAIILLTLMIRIVLFPLMHTSTVSMRKMQKVQPKVKAIQAKYKKDKKDPQARAKMNQEMMELYKIEGVNPMGGCLPMLVQLPILWALYTLFAYSITMRHAPFMLWIHDLSAKDPYYITPILMTFTMWLQQKLAPQAGDAQQQKMFRLMPLIFGIMFLGFPSGLVLYWLTNNVLTILQQEVTFHLMGERKPAAATARKGKKR